ncbi:MAG: helix-hairpin-helix domain-containing protein [Gemmatimonadota bacterium]
MQRRERNALILLFAIGLGGHGLRCWQGRGDGAPGDITLLPDPTAGALTRHRAEVAHRLAPLGPSEKIDLNHASAEEIARLPKVGAGLAKTIVRDREAHGLFVTLGDLDRVEGVGPGLLAAFAGHVIPSDTIRGRILKRPPKGTASTISQAPTGRGPGPDIPTTRLSVRHRKESADPGQGPKSQVDINSASEADLMGLPGIGAAKARAILAYRQRNGPFASVEALTKVPGMSPKLVGRLGAQVVVR